ncbi:zf-HC2 domain-containing protein [Streptosporangium sp. NBC_01495]|uniref:anti-sigma factor family protein n=1 Tax=Streptosporangium sp. NBC_01495 TaxID=2903899 RepID=UPI002E318FE3|nr:zf-HC2 domain-containing protein [Streptosporangium sp. NBC_01495]
MTSQVEHTDVGAYALGILGEPDRTAFSDHLATCPSCTAELRELSGVADALAGIGPLRDNDGADADAGTGTGGRGPAEVVSLLRRRKAADRRARRGTFVIGAAAAVTLVAGGIAVGTSISGESGSVPVGHSAHGPAEDAYRAGTPLAGTGASGVTGGLVLETKGWGTHAVLELRGVKGPLECELIAVSPTGERRVVTGWAVPERGYGVPGSPEPLYVHGGVAWEPAGIDRFEVRTTGGDTLLTVTV